MESNLSVPLILQIRTGPGARDWEEGWPTYVILEMHKQDWELWLCMLAPSACRRP